MQHRLGIEQRGSRYYVESPDFSIGCYIDLDMADPGCKEGEVGIADAISISHS